MNSRDILDRLRRDGFELVSIKGSHHKLAHPISRRVVIVPYPCRDIPIGTLKSIYRQAGWRSD